MSAPGVGHERTRSGPGAYQEWARHAPGVGQEQTGSGSRAHQEWTRSVPGVGQERTRSEPGAHQERNTSGPEACQDGARSVQMLILQQTYANNALGLGANVNISLDVCKPCLQVRC